MTTIKVPSSIVPIDVSGQSFSRMANFRRSLIHVDFFIRRKKIKDKRRNTVTEGDTKELKDVLQNIINEECQRTVMPTFMSHGENIRHGKDPNSKLHNENNKISSAEKNNNSSESDASSIIIKNFNKIDANSEEKNKINTTKNENVKLDSKFLQASETMKPSTVNKRKPKSHIPISTVSAAMNVAVKMRQLNVNNKVEDQSSSGNWSYSSDINSSDSENKTNFSDNNRYVINTELNDIDTSVSNGKVYGNSSNVMSMNLEELHSSVIKEIKETEISSCTSSDNNTAHDDETSNGTSAESDTFFISSDESDDSSDIIFKNNYGSSLSLSTVSDGSLNSLLSQTGTEMTSSTGTLTSIGLEQLPTPPPPPPAIVAATAADNEVTSICDQQEIFNKERKLQKQEKIALTSSSVKSNKEHKSTQKSLKSRKYSKAEKVDSLKYSTENSKNIFSTLINMKSKTKEQNKHKISQNKINKLENAPHFNVYGSSSPKITKPMSLFLKDNISPVKENERRNHLQSFSSNQSKTAQEIHSENKSKHVKSEFSVPFSNNSPLHKTHIPANVSSVLDTSKVEVPLKYVHKVTVTPIQRLSNCERNNSIAACKKSLFKDDIYQQQITETNTDCKPKPNVINSTDSSNGKVFYYCEKPKPQYPTAVQTRKPKLAARVLLDPDGRVVQCTNSLDRRFYHQIPVDKYTNDINPNYSVKYPINEEVIKSEDETNLLGRNHSQYFPASVDKGNRFTNSLLVTNNRPSSIAVAFERRKSEGYETTRYPNFLITPPERHHSEMLHSRASTGTNMRQTSCFESVYNRSPKEITGTFQNTHTMLPPNPNISGLPSNEIMFTQHNVNLHSEQMKILGMSSFEENNCRNTDDSFCDSLQKSSQSHLNTEMIKPQQSTMSTEDLFAVIHNCKKRMNIKTDSDISLTSSSSRSSSPSYLRPTSSKGALAETGFLSPRNSSSFDSSRDRRSWADFRPMNSMPPERKSLASDRLGPTKPTSMHDFKMLLLQTRSNSQVLGPRKSAVEMLKVPSSQDKAPKITSTPFSLSPCSPSSYSVPNSPSSELYLYNGHSTVPFKRNTRARSSLQSRYTIYPPIFEDCSEDFENTRETQQICSETAVSNNEPKNIQLQHSVVNNSSENTMQKTRHWL